MNALQPGQRWKYRTRPGEADSTLLILKREEIGDMRVVHIAIDGLHLKNPYAPGGLQTTLTHSPVAEDAVQDSVTELLEDNVPIAAEQPGYDQWRDMHGRGEAGIFTLTVAEILRALEETVNRPTNPSGNSLFQKTKPKFK